MASTLEDFRDQLKQIKKLGSMESILKMLPFGWPLRRHAASRGQVDEKQFVRAGSHHQFHDALRAPQPRDHLRLPPQTHRRGSGTSVQDVNQLLRQYAQMSKMFKQMGKGGLAKQMMRGGMSGMMGKQKFGR